MLVWHMIHTCGRFVKEKQAGIHDQLDSNSEFLAKLRGEASETGGADDPERGAEIDLQ